jgi:DNA-binding NtrC family response regulator
MMPRLKKILVVDDENGTRALLSEVLAGEGFDVSLAKDGQESLDQLRRCRFDLVITDIEMPRLDGIAMLNRMRQAGRKEKVIIMTGRSLDNRPRDIDAPPVVNRLQKPFRVDRFLDAVGTALAETNKVQRKRKAKSMC